MVSNKKLKPNFGEEKNETKVNQGKVNKQEILSKILTQNIYADPQLLCTC